jgi:hypothetical protein
MKTKATERKTGAAKVGRNVAKKKTPDKKKDGKQRKTSVGSIAATYTRAAGRSTSRSTSSPHSAPRSLFRTKRIQVSISIARCSNVMGGERGHGRITRYK